MNQSSSPQSDLSGFRYRNIQPLERTSGSMADLYTATVDSATVDPTSVEQQVVLKVALTQGENMDVSEQMLLTEFEYLRWMSHPNIVRSMPIEMDTLASVNYRARSNWAGQPWFGVLEWIRGGNLHNFLRQSVHFSPCVTLEIGRQMALALDYIHGKQKIAHMDLKPSHILFRRYPHSVTEVEVVLIDFGSACSIGTEFTETATIRLNNYLSPERIEAMNQNRSYRVAASDDIYILGLILYQLFTNRLPFPQSDPASKVEAILNSLPVLPSKQIEAPADRRSSQSWQQIDDAIMGMLQRNPNDRPSAQQLAIALHEALFWFGCYAQTEVAKTAIKTSGTETTSKKQWFRWSNLGFAVVGLLTGYGLHQGTTALSTATATTTPLPTATIEQSATVTSTTIPSPTAVELPTATMAVTIEPTIEKIPTITATQTPAPPTSIPTSTRAAIATATSSK